MLAHMLSVGILGALCFGVVEALVPPPQPLYVTRIVQPSAENALTIVDVSRAATEPAQLAQAIRLASDEQVIAVNDVAVHDLLAAGAAIGETTRAPGSYLDLTVRGTSGERRLLVLVH